MPFRIIGSPPGADLPFKRVIEHLGETRFHFAARLCRMRNIYMMDSLQGVVGFRGPGKESGYVLRQGYNMLRGRVLLQNDDQSDPIIIDGMDTTTSLPTAIERCRALRAFGARTGRRGSVPRRPATEPRCSCAPTGRGLTSCSRWSTVT
ncbi:hypothetical protein ACQPTN_00660 [Bradyrhizobium sp. 13971]|uniref:hypothetical protein n=1 Tax=Bradyrhizobium elkanii TaxID=29448 RepID=UPI0008422107|nr:hypothetical protein [Bradyrhizobium elkanii]ODM84329.1 hypothetical protein A6452_16415 [Bradyrhizobium elkanii]ODM86279.1 hypothetical protein A6X20_01125 [Bradyrhizobium elkanii]